MVGLLRVPRDHRSLLLDRPGHVRRVRGRRRRLVVGARARRLVGGRGGGGGRGRVGRLAARLRVGGGRRAEPLEGLVEAGPGLDRGLVP